MIKSVRTQQNYAANTSTPLSIASNDDNVQRTLMGVLISDNTAQLHTQIVKNGQVIADIDHATAARLTQPFPLDTVYPIGIQFSFNFINPTGAAVNNVGIELLYTIQTSQ